MLGRAGSKALAYLFYVFPKYTSRARKFRTDNPMSSSVSHKQRCALALQADVRTFEDMCWSQERVIYAGICMDFTIIYHLKVFIISSFASVGHVDSI